MTKRISRDELKQKIDREEGFLLVETLPPFEYERGHLPGAIDIPSNQIGELSASLLPDKTAEIVVYCSGPECHSSEVAAEELAQLGYTNILVYPEGKEGWAEAKYAFEMSTGAEALLTINHD